LLSWSVLPRLAETLPGGLADMSLKVDLRVGEELRLDGGRIVISLLEKSGQRARISVEADESVSIQVPDKDPVPAKGGISLDVHKKMLVGAV